MKISNQTRYETPGIRAMILAGLKEVCVPHEKLFVRIVYNRRRGSTWHGGCAILGSSRLEPKAPLPAGVEHMDPEDVAKIVAERADGERGYRTRFGRWMTLSLPREPHLVDVGEFCRTIIHEALHLKGCQHRDMTPDQRYCRGPFPAWAVGLKAASGELAQIRMRPAAPAPSKEERAEDRRAKRLEHLRKMVSLWDMRLRRAKTIQAKWRRKLALAERYDQQKMAAKEPKP